MTIIFHQRFVANKSITGEFMMSYCAWEEGLHSGMALNNGGNSFGLMWNCNGCAQFVMRERMVCTVELVSKIVLSRVNTPCKRHKCRI